MSDQTAQIVPSAGSSSSQLSLGYEDATKFAHIQRVAKMFASSSLVPDVFKNCDQNVVIALEMAHRMGASPLMVMQNLDIIYGRPAFRSTFNIASVNACGRFTPLRFVEVGERGKESWGYYAQATARIDNFLCKGTTVTMEIARLEGWIEKKGSKWKTMPELMLQYRAATWWTRMYAPELLMGFQTSDEVIEIQAAPEHAPAAPAPAAEPEQLPVTPRRARGVAGARREAEKTVDATEPAKTVEPVKPADPAPAPAAAAPAPTPEVPAPAPAAPAAQVPASDPTPPPVDPAPAQADPSQVAPRTMRCEITNATEKNARKAGGVIGPVCTVSLTGEFTGDAYFDGSLEQVPANGAVIDAVIQARRLPSGAPTNILVSFTQVT